MRFLIAFVCFVFCIVQLFAFSAGTIDGSVNARVFRFEDTYAMCQPRGKWGYVFPAFKVGCKFGTWMTKE